MTAHCVVRAPLIFAVLLAAPSLCTSQASEHRSISVTFENDAFFGSSDSSYTNGIRVTWDLLRHVDWLRKASRVTSFEWLADAVNGARPIRATRRACAPHESREDGARNCMSVGFSLAQTMYTPSDIVDPVLQVNDRPYAGMLYGSLYVNTLRHRAQYSSELQVGATGPASGSEGTQSLAHWTWSTVSAKPRGWGNQLRTKPQVGLVNTYMYRPAFLEYCRTKFGCNGAYGENRILDVTPRAETVLGTHMVRGSGGGMLRIGWRFPDAVGLTRIPTTAARSADDGSGQFWFNGFVGFDGRAVLHNTFITGISPFGNDRWNDARQIALRRGVSELSYGGAAGFARGTVVVQVVERSAEYAPNGGSHRFGSVTLMLHTPKVARGRR